MRFPEIAFAFRMCAEIGISVIQDLRVITGRSVSPGHEATIDTIVFRLAAIRRGESPNVDADSLQDVKPLKRTAA